MVNKSEKLSSRQNTLSLETYSTKSFPNKFFICNQWLKLLNKSNDKTLRFIFGYNFMLLPLTFKDCQTFYKIGSVLCWNIFYAVQWLQKFLTFVLPVFIYTSAWSSSIETFNWKCCISHFVSLSNSFLRSFVDASIRWTATKKKFFSFYLTFVLFL